MTIQVRLGERGPFNFLIDTGADRTVVSSDVAGLLKLVAGNAAILHSVTGQQRVPTAGIDRLHFSNKTVRDVEAAVLNNRDIGADGILGIDSLRSDRVTFDFKKQQMTIVPSASRPERARKDEVVVRGKLRSGRLVLTQASAAGRRLSVVVDTGADVSVGNGALMRALQRSGRYKHRGMVQMRSVTGELLSGELLTIASFEIGGRDGAGPQCRDRRCLQLQSAQSPGQAGAADGDEYAQGLRAGFDRLRQSQVSSGSS
jgi:predicted aspartyl protease